MVMSGRSVIPTTLFLGRLRPLKWLTSTKSTYWCLEVSTDIWIKGTGVAETISQLKRLTSNVNIKVCFFFLKKKKETYDFNVQ